MTTSVENIQISPVQLREAALVDLVDEWGNSPSRPATPQRTGEHQAWRRHRCALSATVAAHPRLVTSHRRAARSSNPPVYA